MEIKCAITGEIKEVVSLKDGSPKLPMGWKRLGDQYFSPKGFKQKYYTQTTQLPVASVALEEKEPNWSPEACKAAWKLFRSALKLGCREAAQLATVLMGEMRIIDCLPLEDGPKGKKLPKKMSMDTKAIQKRLYDVGREQFPNLNTASLSAIRQRVLKKYKDEQFEVRILCKRSIPSYKETEPLPIPVSVYDLFMRERQPFVRLNIGGQRFILRLANGRKFERRIATLERIFAGQGRLGELNLAFKANGATHRNGSTQRYQSGSNQVQTIVVASISVQLEKTFSDRQFDMLAKTANKELFQVFIGDQEHPWLLHEDHVKRWIAHHRQNLLDLSDDQKMERRVPRAERADINGYRDKLVKKHERRITKHIHKIAFMLVELARRRRVANLNLDLTDKSWYVSFPWFRLVTRIEQLAAKCGIIVAVIDPDATNEDRTEGSGSEEEGTEENGTEEGGTEIE